MYLNGWNTYVEFIRVRMTHRVMLHCPCIQQNHCILRDELVAVDEVLAGCMGGAQP